MTIFEALRVSHDRQRALCEDLVNAKEKDEQNSVYAELKLELTAHAAAEERHFYVPLMERDKGLDLSRHAIAEHHEMDEIMETLEELETGDTAWLREAKKLAHKVEHHLEEEEQKFFQQAGKILTETEKTELASEYESEEKAYKQKHG